MKEKILGLIAAVVFMILRWTWRIKLEFESKEDLDFFKSFGFKKFPQKNYLLAFYHRDELSLVPYFAFSGMGTLVSISKDGEIMSTVAKFLRYHLARGSSSKKAISGLISAMKHVKNGGNFSLAVDGPRGPIYKVKPGIIALSNKTDTPIFPIVAHPNNFYTFTKAWNKARIPYPFTRITLKFGKLTRYDEQSLESTLLTLDKSDKK